MWARVQIGNKLRSLLREYFPATLDAVAVLPQVGGLARADVRLILAAAPTPAQEATLSVSKLEKLLIRAGRQRFLQRDAQALRAVLRTPQLHQPPVMEQAMGIRMLALLRQFDAACQAADELAEAVNAHFGQHSDAEILLRFPGLGTLTGAKVLAEIGDDRHRFTDARELKAYAGSAPITRISGRKSVIVHQQIKNNRLIAIYPIWTLATLKASEGARRHYQQRQAAGDWHRVAQRNL